MKDCDTCLNRQTRRSLSRLGYSEVGKTDYVCAVETGKQNAELTIRFLNRPRGLLEPEDGVFLVAADLNSTTSDKIEVSLDGPEPSFIRGDFMTTASDWLKGGRKDCPKLF